MPAAHPEWRTTLDAEELRRVRSLAEDVARADAVAAFSEPTMLDLRGAAARGPTHHALVADPDATRDGLLGYAHVDASEPAAPVVELAVSPARRRHGVGAALADAVLAAFPEARAWAHGDHPAAARLAAGLGLRRARELWMMRRDPSAGPLPAQPLPEGVAVRALRVGVDEPAMVAVNNRAFAWHPEQAGLTEDDVRVREAEPWFDAEGFLLAWDVASGDLLGFHWTKVHERSASVPRPVGEVYVLGVDPAAQGRRLGSVLTLAGLEHLAARGFDTVILYVEGDNAPAIATYTKLGFVRAAVDVSYAR